MYVSWSGGADATSVVCEETREGVSGVCDGVRFGRVDTGERKKGRWGRDDGCGVVEQWEWGVVAE